MNRIDKETLADIYTSIKDLVTEARSLLKLEAASDIYNKAKVSWLAEMESALGDNQYTNPFKTSFWITLEELGILNAEGLTDDLDEVEASSDDEYDAAWRREWNEYIKPSINEPKEEPDDIESYDEMVFDAVSSQDSLDSADVSDTQLVEGSPIEDKKAPKVEPATRAPGKYYRANSDLYYTKHTNNGTEHYVNDHWHRVVGPAVVRLNGDKFWYQFGKLHRENGPAIELATGHKEWWLDGKLHREDGSAIEHATGISGKGYALFGQIFDSQREWEAAKNLRAMKTTSTALVVVPKSNHELPLIYG